MTGVTQFIQAADNSTLRSELHQELLSSAISLGVLSWQRTEGGLGASKFIFPWVEEGEVAAHVFDLIREEAAGRVEETFNRRVS